MASGAAVLRNWSIRGKEALGVTWRLEALPTALPLTRRLGGVLGPVMEISVLPMLHARQDLPFRGLIAFQLIGDDDPGNVVAAFEQLPKALLGRCCIAAALDETIEHRPVVIYRPPQVMAFALDGQKHFVKMPLVA
jgi:hypothetical protein